MQTATLRPTTSSTMKASKNQYFGFYMPQTKHTTTSNGQTGLYKYEEPHLSPKIVLRPLGAFIIRLGGCHAKPNSNPKQHVFLRLPRNGKHSCTVNQKYMHTEHTHSDRCIASTIKSQTTKITNDDPNIKRKALHCSQDSYIPYIHCTYPQPLPKQAKKSYNAREGEVPQLTYWILCSSFVSLVQRV